MQRIAKLDPTQANDQQKQVLETVEQKFGGVLNIFGTMAHSPVTANTYFAMNKELEQSTLSPAFREQIALTVAEANACEYCLSAHTYIGKAQGLSEDAVDVARNAKSGDAKEQAGLAFAQAIVLKQGNVSDQDLADVKAAGYTEGEIFDILTVVTLNILTNYFNHIAGTEVDLPKVSPRTESATVGV